MKLTNPRSSILNSAAPRSSRLMDLQGKRLWCSCLLFFITSGFCIYKNAHIQIHRRTTCLILSACLQHSLVHPPTPHLWRHLETEFTTNDWNSCKTSSLGVWSINIGDISVNIRCPCLSGLCLKDKKPWVSPWRENTWVVFYPHTSLFCQWSMVRLLIRLASLSNELMAIKLLKSLTFESNGQLCSSTNLHRRDRTAQSPAASDHSPAFSLSYRIQVTLTAPRSLPRTVHGQYAIKTIILSNHLRSHQGLVGCGFRVLGDAWALMHCFASCNGRHDIIEFIAGLFWDRVAPRNDGAPVSLNCLSES